MASMVRLNRIYTGTGDDGTTGLADGRRVPKHDLRIAATGTVDELNSVLGFAVRTGAGRSSEMGALLERVQNDLFDLGADLATPGADPTSPGGREVLRISEPQVKALESAIDRLNARLEPLTSFVLPGGEEPACWLHLARTVCRRAERRVAELGATEPVNLQALPYLNRLGDLLFVLARVANDEGREDRLWVPGEHRGG
jgi:cob(I)alamin adenosyltransferase